MCPWTAARSPATWMPSLESVTTRTATHRSFAAASSRSHFDGETIGRATVMDLNPPAMKTSASSTVVTVTPDAPSPICLRPISRDLWVLAWGRSATPCRSARYCMARRFAISLVSSSNTAGVSNSSNIESDLMSWTLAVLCIRGRLDFSTASCRGNLPREVAK